MAAARTTRSKTGRFTANAMPRLVEALELVKQGCPIGAACARAGVHKDTWYEHLKQAAVARQKPSPTLADKRLIAWADAALIATDAAEAFLYEQFLEQAMMPRGKGNWLPWIKVLALRFPSNWAERRIQQADLEETSELDLEKLTREELLELRTLVRKAREQDDPQRRLRAV